MSPLSVPILSAITHPLTLMAASWKATTANAGLATLAVLFFGDIWAILFGFGILQAAAIYFTYKDCHFIEVMMATFKCKGTPMLLQEAGHRYVG